MDGQTDRERQKPIEIDRQTDGERDGRTDRQREREIEKDRQTETSVCRSLSVEKTVEI